MAKTIRVSQSVRQTVNTGSSGPPGGGLGPVFLLAAVAVCAFAVVSVAAAVGHAVMILLVWLLAVFGGAIVIAGVLAWVFRARIRSMVVRRGDPRDRIDQIEAEKRAELARIRAMRLQIDAARIAGVEITPELLQVAEDPRLYDMVMRLRGAAGVVGRRAALEYAESGPRGGD